MGLSWFFNRTRAGLRMTAVAEDHQVALSMGISVKRSIAFAWVLGCAALDARRDDLSERQVAQLPRARTSAWPRCRWRCWPGSNRSPALLLAGVIVGIVQGLATAYLDPIVGGAVGSVLPFVIMLLILLVRPTGMFGWKTIERV